MRIVLALVLFGILPICIVNAQTSQPRAAQTTAAPNQTELSNADEVRALEQDSQHMRIILNQMRENLGFVGNTTMPINHQFALEIDMWQLALDQMDRRIARLRAVPGK
jgi:hypothetical protein